MDEAEITLYHVLRTVKRRVARTIRQIQDQSGRITDPNEITHTFLERMRDKYGPIEVTDNGIDELLSAIQPQDRTDYAAYLEQPITSEELFTALNSGGSNKSLGPGGINRGFYITLWDTVREDLLEILNEMFLHNCMTQR
jgi:hypothetical protein